LTKDADDFDRKLEKTKKIIILIVIPVLFISAGIVYFSTTEEEENKPNYTQILSEVNLKCYNVNWFGTFGFQLTFMDTIKEIGEKLDEYDMDFSNEEFFKDQEVVDYLVINCPHVDSRLNVPDDYDPFVGVPALDKCLQAKEGFVDSEDYCLQFKR